MRPRVLVVGDVADDVVVRPDGPIQPDTDTTSRIERRAGGAAANTACWLGVLGVATDFVGSVHRDDLERHAALLAACGVTPHLAPVDEPTGTVVSVVEGGRRALLTSRGANVLTTPERIDDGLLRGATHLHLTGYSLFGPDGPAAWGPLIARAGRLGLTRSVDPSSASYLVAAGVPAFLAAVDGVEVLLPGADEARALTGRDDPSDAALDLAVRHAVVAVKRGAGGSVAVADGGRVEQAALPGPVVDPTGAGDAFDAGFLAARLAGAGAAEALAAGARTAADAIAIVGARPA